MSRLSVNKSSELQCNPDMQLPAENEGGNCWFAIRVSYSRELALKAILDAENIENFIPMRYEYIMKSGKQLSSIMTGAACTGSNTPPIPTPPLRCTFFPIWAHEPTVAQVSTIVPEST